MFNPESGIIGQNTPLSGHLYPLSAKCATLTFDLLYRTWRYSGNPMLIVNYWTNVQQIGYSLYDKQNINIFVLSRNDLNRMTMVYILNVKQSNFNAATHKVLPQIRF